MKTNEALSMDHPSSFPYTIRTQLDPRMATGFILGESESMAVNRNGDSRANLIAQSAYVANENGLFSSSLSDLFSRDYNSGYNYTVAAKDAVTSNYEECFESLEELEAKTIGNLLPDDDELLSDAIIHLKNGEETEDLDMFSNVGGLELGEDGFLPRKIELSDIKSQAEQPSRTLFVRNINSIVEDSDLNALFSQYGDIRNLDTAWKHRGFVMISFYDIRAACNAKKALHNKTLTLRKLDIHFSLPKENPSAKDINQGTLTLFNHDSSVSKEELHELFSFYGEVKEIRENSHGSRCNFVEFYDVRAAESALRALGSEITGTKIKLELGGPVDSKRITHRLSSELDKEESGISLPQLSPSSNLAVAFSGSLSFGSISSCVSNILPLRSRIEQSHVTDSGHIRNHPKIQGSPNFHPHSLPEYNNSVANGLRFESPSNVASNFSSRPPEIIYSQQFRRVIPDPHPLELTEAFGFSASRNGHQTWNNSYGSQPRSIIWPGSPSFVNGISAISPQQLHGVPFHNTHIGSAPSFDRTFWNQRHSYTGESPSGIVPRAMPFPSKSIGLHPHHQRCMVFPARSQTHAMFNAFEAPNERSRSRRNEGSLSQTENKQQFELDIYRILQGEDNRTTLMIKNIPNKYTSKMLLSTIDERHKGTYDFIYLPIDFKNKCNVGYAFINMIEPSLIVPFHKTFDGKRWEKFNSEKVASLAYGRIQGKAALISHFQNSSLMNEDKRCRPILFNTNGPNAGDQVPFPVGNNIRARPGKLATNDENLLACVVGDDSSTASSSD